MRAVIDTTLCEESIYVMSSSLQMVQILITGSLADNVFILRGSLFGREGGGAEGAGLIDPVKFHLRHKITRVRKASLIIQVLK